MHENDSILAYYNVLRWFWTLHWRSFDMNNNTMNLNWKLLPASDSSDFIKWPKLSITDPKSACYDGKITENNPFLRRILTKRVFKLGGGYISFISTRFRISFSLNSKIWTSYFHCITRRCLFMSFWFDVSLDSFFRGFFKSYES